VWVVLALVTLGAAGDHLAAHSRFGAWLQAVRDNEDAARAIGVDPFRVKLGAIGLSGPDGRGRRVLRAGVPVHRRGHRLRPGHLGGGAGRGHRGRLGTLWGPVLGALVLHLLADFTRNLFGELPGINMVIYGAVLVLDRDVRAARPRAGQSVRGLWSRQL
jgi:branched-chain amino acid transport system permease protein